MCQRFRSAERRTGGGWQQAAGASSAGRRSRAAPQGSGASAPRRVSSGSGGARRRGAGSEPADRRNRPASPERLPAGAETGSRAGGGGSPGCWRGFPELLVRFPPSAGKDAGLAARLRRSLLIAPVARRMRVREPLGSRQFLQPAPATAFAVARLARQAARRLRFGAPTRGVTRATRSRGSARVASRARSRGARG
jgi:hypothetical protein